MRLCDIREVCEQIGNCELHFDARSRVAFADHRLVLRVLLQKFLLHGVPHNLIERESEMRERRERGAPGEDSLRHTVASQSF